LLTWVALATKFRLNGEQQRRLLLAAAELKMQAAA
jgi:hypothetical protein